MKINTLNYSKSAMESYNKTKDSKKATDSELIKNNTQNCNSTTAES